jgi:hypothetical protein
MNKMECAREQAVVEAVTSGQWTEELRSHASNCEVCADVVEVVHALHSDYAVASHEARIPSAGLVWWRAELRARREAMQAAQRPMTLVQAFGGACTAGVLIAVLIQTRPWLMEWLPSGPIDAVDLLRQHLPLAFTLGVLLVLAPVALYFVFSDK